MKMIKVFNVYINPDMVTSVEGFDDVEGNKGKFKIGLSGGDPITGQFGYQNGKPKHTIESLVSAINNGTDLVDWDKCWE